MKEFKPTWLYVKKHSVTGLLYFGKTTLSTPINYIGSGKYWRNHLKVHGTQIETIWCMLFTDYSDLIEFAELFSEFFDVAKSDDWANLKAENGLDGGSDKGRPGRVGYTHTDTTRKKMSVSHTGKALSEETRQKLKGRYVSVETKEKMRASNRSSSEAVRARISEACRDRVVSLEARLRMSNAARNRNRKRSPMSAETKEKISKSMKNRLTPVLQSLTLTDDK